MITIKDTEGGWGLFIYSVTFRVYSRRGRGDFRGFVDFMHSPIAFCCLYFYLRIFFPYWLLWPGVWWTSGEPLYVGCVWLFNNHIIIIIIRLTHRVWKSEVMTISAWKNGECDSRIDGARIALGIIKSRWFFRVVPEWVFQNSCCRILSRIALCNVM